MSSNNSSRIFAIDQRILLGVIFSLITIGSMSASASYADCEATKECFLVQMPSMSKFTDDEAYKYDSLSVALQDGMAVLNQTAPVIAASPSAGFQVSQGKSTDSPQPLLLLMLLGVLLAVMLVRAKSFNGK
jgi:hypothetical protein